MNIAPRRNVYVRLPDAQVARRTISVHGGRHGLSVDRFQGTMERSTERVRRTMVAVFLALVLLYLTSLPKQKLISMADDDTPAVPGDEIGEIITELLLRIIARFKK